VVTVRYFAAARAAAGRTEEVTEAATLGALVTALSRAHGEGLARVLRVASFLVDGVAWRDRQASLPDRSTVDVLPPFAGG
jgi:molybdopterin converting factor small subunit